MTLGVRIDELEILENKRGKSNEVRRNYKWNYNGKKKIKAAYSDCHTTVQYVTHIFPAKNLHAH
ncbi:MAG: hypothetical protein IH934_07650 [Nanoarchaeota archaeon]|nr:hypothetical protein [Nanoarchaeota archaeon]